MVTKTLKMKALINWNIMFSMVSEDGDIIIQHNPDQNTYVRIKLDAASKTALKAKRQTIINFMEQEITLNGEVVERFEKRTAPVTSEVLQWVKVT